MSSAKQRAIAQMFEAIQASVTTNARNLSALQEICEHPDVVKKHCTNTDNYDSPDYYWTQFNCPDCRKRWEEDGSL